MSSWFSWNEPYSRTPRRDMEEVVSDTLMLEFNWQLKEAERQQRERDNEYRRLQSGVDYSWLANTPRSSFNVSPGESFGLEELCCRVPPPYCGLVILKFREAMQANDPDVQEVSGLFRAVLLETLDGLKEEQEAQRLSNQWNNKRAVSMSLMNFRSRIKINPFGSTVGLTTSVTDGTGLSDLKTVSEDVERAQRTWSMPDFRYKGGSGSSKVA
ncbi:protein RD3 [Pseudochaenichthys georgianus]|uniref:protein RD3 n=1 Tax=Pseudochaenichthys georgianus TaxID=52239 RepID=UPI00146BEBE9|nr:protein RD3 [Pseudochaenichthys georgianus]